MPRKEFAPFTRLDASDVNTYLMDQAVQTFAGTAARGSAISEPVEGMVTYLEDLNRYDTYNGSSHVPMDGLTLVKTQTIGSSVASVTVTNAFSADYDNYKIIVTGGTGTGNGNMTLQFNATTANYRCGAVIATYSSGASSVFGDFNSTLFTFAGYHFSSGAMLSLDVYSPFLEQRTIISGAFTNNTASGSIHGLLTLTTSQTDFTIGASGVEMTGGTIFVYGYKKA
jgi:hypothetical protein